MSADLDGLRAYARDLPERLRGATEAMEWAVDEIERLRADLAVAQADINLLAWVIRTADVDIEWNDDGPTHVWTSEGDRWAIMPSDRPELRRLLGNGVPA